MENLQALLQVSQDVKPDHGVHGMTHQFLAQPSPAVALAAATPSKHGFQKIAVFGNVIIKIYPRGYKNGIFGENGQAFISELHCCSLLPLLLPQNMLEQLVFSSLTPTLSSSTDAGCDR